MFFASCPVVLFSHRRNRGQRPFPASALSPHRRPSSQGDYQSVNCTSELFVDLAKPAVAKSVLNDFGNYIYRHKYCRTCCRIPQNSGNLIDILKNCESLLNCFYLTSHQLLWLLLTGPDDFPLVEILSGVSQYE